MTQSTIQHGVRPRSAPRAEFLLKEIAYGDDAALA
jgi:hypothetical protein